MIYVIRKAGVLPFFEYRRMTAGDQGNRAPLFGERLHEAREVAGISEQVAMAEGSYTYTVLRYVHDLGTSEFLNAGVVVASCDAPCVAAKFKTTCGRIKGAFPSLDTEVFLARMKRLQACFDGIDAARCAELRAREGASIAAWIRCVLPVEDRALYWSPIGNGVGGPLAATLQLLYERCVMRHDRECTVTGLSAESRATLYRRL